MEDYYIFHFFVLKIPHGSLVLCKLYLSTLDLHMYINKSTCHLLNAAAIFLGSGLGSTFHCFDWLDKFLVKRRHATLELGVPSNIGNFVGLHKVITELVDPLANNERSQLDLRVSKRNVR